MKTWQKWQSTELIQDITSLLQNLFIITVKTTYLTGWHVSKDSIYTNQTSSSRMRVPFANPLEKITNLGWTIYRQFLWAK